MKIENLLFNKIDRIEYDNYGTQKFQTDSLRQLMVERNYTYACTQLSKERNRRRVKIENFDLMSKSLYDFIEAMGASFVMDEDTIEFSEFIDDNITVKLRGRTDLRLKINCNMSPLDDISDQCLLVYKEQGDDLMVNESLANAVRLIKRLINET